MISYKAKVDQYVKNVLNGKKLVGKEVYQACQRYNDDLKREDLEFRQKDADLVIGIIERTMVHKQGEDLEG